MHGQLAWDLISHSFIYRKRNRRSIPIVSTYNDLFRSDFFYRL